LSKVHNAIAWEHFVFEEYLTIFDYVTIRKFWVHMYVVATTNLNIALYFFTDPPPTLDTLYYQWNPSHYMPNDPVASSNETDHVAGISTGLVSS